MQHAAEVAVVLSVSVEVESGVLGGLGVAARYFLSLSIHISVSLCILRVCQGGSTISIYINYQPSMNQPTNHQPTTKHQAIFSRSFFGTAGGGVFAPLTLCSTLLVDGVLCSCFAPPEDRKLIGNSSEPGMVSKYGHGEIHRNPLDMEVFNGFKGFQWLPKDTQRRLDFPLPNWRSWVSPTRCATALWRPCASGAPARARGGFKD